MDLRLLAYGLLALAIMGAIGTGVYKVKQWGASEVRAEWDEAKTVQREEEVQRSINAALRLLEDRKARRNEIRERTTYVDRFIEKLVSTGACFNPAGVSCVNGSIDGKGTAGCKPDGRLSPTTPAN